MVPTGLVFQCKVATQVLAIVLLTLHLDLSAVEYDDEIIDSSPPDSTMTASVYAACCAGVIFICVANETKFGHFSMSWE